jgi:arylsulfatase A-like enzyme
MNASFTSPAPGWQAGLAIAMAVMLGSALLPASEATRPNVIIILADDLGYGDLGCYGHARHRTPHLDRLAAEGLRFTDFHSNGAMCSPTRAALLTGLYQNRFGRNFESALSNRDDRDNGLPLEATTLAELLRERGYATGAFGKWHLGYEPPFLPTRQGFEEFRGLLSGDGDHHTHRDRAGRADWWHNEERVQESGYTAELLTRHSIAFLERNRERPFFLYLAHLAIHFPWQGPQDPPHRTAERNYESDKFGLIPDPGNVAPHLQAMVESLDAGVGAVMAALRRLQLDSRTLVFFTSDNGGYINYPPKFRKISSNGPLRGQKTDLYEGGHRVPGIAWWPGRIAPGTTAATALSFDLFPTLLNLAGVLPPVHDGTDLAPLLFAGRPLPDRTLFWRAGPRKAVRRGPWKLVQQGDEAPQLFNLTDDVGESRDLATREPARVADFQAALARWENDVDHSARTTKTGRPPPRTP